MICRFWKIYRIWKIFMTQAHISHCELFFKRKSKIWPQKTPFDIWPSKVSMPNFNMSTESLCVKKKRKIVTCFRCYSCKFKFCKSIFSKISFWVLEIFLIIKNISITQNEKFDKFFDRKEPENKIFEPHPKPQKIMVFLIVQPLITVML